MMTLLPKLVIILLPLISEGPGLVNGVHKSFQAGGVGES